MASSTEIADLLRRGLRLWRTNPGLFYRRVGGLVVAPRARAGALVEGARLARQAAGSYSAWRDGNRAADSPGVQKVDESPFLSVLMPVYNPPPGFLEAAVESVQQQTWQRWELCIVDDASSSPQVGEMLRRAADVDPRIRVVTRQTSGHIAQASNDALAVARGDFVLLLDHDDLLDPTALAAIGRTVIEHPAVDLIYSDEDKIETDGSHVEPFFKPAWSPTLLLGCNYITHLAALRRSLVLEAGGFRTETVGSQDHDLFLRVAERAREVAHIPTVLYSWRKSPSSTAGASTAKPYATKARKRSIEDALARRERTATLQPARLNGLFHIRHRLPGRPTMSIVMCGREDDGYSPPAPQGVEVVDTLHLNTREDNLVATVASRRFGGKYLVWLDNQARPLSSESVSLLLEALEDEGVAVAGGASLASRRGGYLQAGITMSDGGQPEYAFAGVPREPKRIFYLNLAALGREVSAVYWGCCAMRRDVWSDLGGITFDGPLDLAMTDLCLRALAAGYRNVYQPLAEFGTRGGLPFASRVAEHRTWPWIDFVDPYWNPNLSPTGSGLPFRHPNEVRPRVVRAASFPRRSPVTSTREAV